MEISTIGYLVESAHYRLRQVRSLYDLTHVPKLHGKLVIMGLGWLSVGKHSKD
jgi:hypothetical protein